MQRRRWFLKLLFAFGILLSAIQPVLPQQTRPVDVVLVLDQSGSMKKNDPKRLMGSSAGRLIEKLSDNDSAGLVFFGNKATVEIPLTSMGEEGQRATLISKTSSIEYTDSQTNIASGIERGLYELKTKGRPDTNQALVFLTDGIMDVGSPAKNEEMKGWLRNQLIQEAKQKDIKIFSIAFSDEADFMLIQELASTSGGEYYRVLDPSDLAGTFDQITAELRKAPKVVAPPAPVAPTVIFPTLPKPVEPDNRMLYVISGGAALVALLTMGGLIWRWRAATEAGPIDLSRISGLNPDLLNESIPNAKLTDHQNSQDITISKHVIKIGRETDNDIVISAPTISGHHAQIEFRRGQFYLRDLRSKNGSFVNTRKVEGEVLLKSGDDVRFDEFKYRFRGPEVADGASRRGMGGDPDPKFMGTLVRDFHMLSDGDNTSPTGGETGNAAARKTAPMAIGTTEMAAAAAAAEVKKTPQKCPIHKDVNARVRCSRCRKLWCMRCLQVVNEVPLCVECRQQQAAN